MRMKKGFRFASASVLLACFASGGVGWAQPGPPPPPPEPCDRIAVEGISLSSSEPGSRTIPAVPSPLATHPAWRVGPAWVPASLFQPWRATELAYGWVTTPAELAAVLQANLRADGRWAFQNVSRADRADWAVMPGFLSLPAFQGPQMGFWWYRVAPEWLADWWALAAVSLAAMPSGLFSVRTDVSSAGWFTPPPAGSFVQLSEGWAVYCIPAAHWRGPACQWEPTWGYRFNSEVLPGEVLPGMEGSHWGVAIYRSNDSCRFRCYNYAR